MNVSSPNIIVSPKREIFLISDTHFNHNNIIKYCDRPFKEADEMNWFMVERWNSLIKPQDKVYHLGDVYMGGGFTREYTDNLLSKLNGHKRLILGNHDNGRDQLLHKHFEKIDMWRHFKEFGLLLTHVPVHPSSLERFDGVPDAEKRSWKVNKTPSHLMKNIHGHTHTNAEPHGDTKNYKCVCVELTDYKPVNIEELRVK